MRAPDLDGRHEPVVGVAGWHAHVHDHDVRDVGADLQQQVTGVARASDHPVPRLLDQCRDAVAQQRVVVGHDHPEARAARADRVAVGGGHVACG